MSGIARTASREHARSARCAPRRAAPARRAWPAARPRPRARPGRSRTRSSARRRARRRGTGCATGPTLRTSSTPTPAGPPHLCAEAAAAGPAVGQRQPTGRGAGVDEQRRAGRGGDLVDAAGRRRPPGWRTGRRRRPARRGAGRSGVEVDAPVRGRRRPSRTARRAAACQAPAWSTAECSTCEASSRSPWRARPASRPSTPRWQACVPLGVKVTSSGRTPRQSATTARALSSISRASRAGPCRRRGSAYPRSRACSSTSRAAGCSGVPDA